MVRFVVLACVLAASVSGAAEGLPPARYKGAMVHVPRGWKVGLSEWYGTNLYPEATLKEIEAGKGATALIAIAPVEPMDKGLAAVMAKHVASMGDPALYDVREEAALAARKHPGGGERLVRQLSMRPKKYPEQQWRRNVVHVLDGGEVAQVFALYTYNVADEQFEQFKMVFEAFVEGARLPSRVKVADGVGGEKALSLYTCHQVIDFVEWLLEAPFTAAQQGMMIERLAGAWKAGDREEIEGVREILKVRAQLEKKSKEEGEAARKLAREEAVKVWREEAAKEPVAKMIVEVYDAANRPIASGAAGEPALTRQAADASLEAVFFMASAVAKVEEFGPTEAQKERWAKELAGAYGAMPVESKKELAGMPVDLAVLRAGWAELPHETQEALAAEWGKVEAVKVVAEQIKASGKAKAVAPGDALARYQRSLEVKLMVNQMSWRSHSKMMSSVYGVQKSGWKYP